MFIENFLEKNKKVTLFLLIIIFAFGVFLRFHDYANRLSMDSDSTRDAVIAIAGARNFQLPLSGPFISITPAVTGPYYWWQIIIATILIPSRFAPWIYMGILSSILILIAYKIGALLEGRLLGLLMALVVTFSPQQISNASFLTNPSVIGFFSCLVVLFFIKLLKEKTTKVNAILFGLFLGIVVNIHFQSVGLLPLLFILLLLGKKNRKVFALALLTFVLTFIPLLFFELNNHWFDTRNILDYLQYGQYKFWVSNRWLIYAFDFWPNLWAFIVGGTKVSSLIIISIFAVSIIFRLLKKQLSKEIIFLGIIFLIQVIMIRYYRGEKYFGYLQFFHPFVFTFTAYAFLSLFRFKFGSLLGILAIVLYVFLVFPTVKSIAFVSGRFVLESNERINTILKWTKGQDYVVYRCTGYDKNIGRSLYLTSYLKNIFDEKSKNKVGYFYGDCQFPENQESNHLNLEGLKVDYNKYYPRITGDMVDLSEASTAAILKANWLPLTAEEEYKHEAHWWYYEHP